MKQRNIYRETLKALTQSWVEYEKYLKAVRRKPSRKDVHRLRNSIQRLNAILKFSLHLHPFPNLKEFIRELQKERKNLGPLRNAQVELQLLKAYHNSSLYKYLEKRQVKAQKRARKKLARISLNDQRNQVQKLESILLDSEVLPAMDEATERLEKAILAQEKNFERNLPKGSRFQPKKLHQMRVAAKEILYQGEALQQILGEPKVDLMKFESIHQFVGDLQNEVQLLKVLEKFLNKKTHAGDRIAQDLHTDLSIDQQQLLAEADRNIRNSQWHH